MKSVTVKQIQKLDEVAINKYGVPSLALMENAGRAVAMEVMGQLKRKKDPRVSIICGLGNNSGDGFVVARHLINAGIKTDIFLIGSANKLKDDAQINYQILKRLKYPIKNVSNNRGQAGIHCLSPIIKASLKRANIILDAVFGVGLSREVKDPFASVILEMNASKRKIVSVDVPSGLDGTTGKVYGICVKAHTTVTFSFAKKGFFKSDGPKYVGKVKVVDIGIPVRIKKKVVSGQ